MHYVKLADGHELPVQVIGRGQPVIMLHGFGMHPALWLPFVLPYSRKFKFYLPHFRGFGEANVIPINQADALANYVHDLELMVSHFKLERFLVAGISMGALTSLKWQQLGQSWARVERYLHIDQSPAPVNAHGWSHGLFGNQQEEMFVQFRALVEALSPYKDHDFYAIPEPLRAQMRANMAQFFQYAMSRDRHKKLIALSFRSERALTMVLPVEGWWNYIVCMQAYLDCPYDFRASLADCTTPVTVFTGMQSAMYPPQGQLAIKEMAGDVKTVRFQQSGHMPLFDEPLKFIREFGRFLRG